MKTYRVKMNNSINAGDRYEPNKPRGIRCFYVNSDSVAGAASIAERQFAGVCEAVTLKAISSKSLKVKDLQDDIIYEVLAATETPSESIAFKKSSDVIYVTLRNGQFSERGLTFWFDMSILEYVHPSEDSKNPPPLRLEALEKISIEIYEMVIERKIPFMFEGKMDLVKPQEQKEKHCLEIRR